MVAQINQPKKDDTLSKLLQVGGAAAGIIAAPATGGASAMLTGAAGGAALGGLAGGLIEGPQASNNSSSAVDRRLGQAGGVQVPLPEDPREVLQRSMFALRDAPREVQQQHGPTIQAAMLKLNRGQV